MQDYLTKEDPLDPYLGIEQGKSTDDNGITSPEKGEEPAPCCRYERSKSRSKSPPRNGKSVVEHTSLEASQSQRAPQKDSIHNLIYDSKFFDSVFNGEDKDYIKRKNLLKNQLKKNFPVDAYLKNHYNKRHMYVYKVKSRILISFTP